MQSLTLKDFPAPNPTLKERFDRLVEKAVRNEFRVDGVAVAWAFLSEKLLERMEGLVFSDEAMGFHKKKTMRIEFIADTPLPPELNCEPSTKKEPLFAQIIGYNLCKACRLCIEVCPKHVYKDDGFGRPSQENRRTEECTGAHQCAQCVDICPENTIHVVLANTTFKSTLFVLLPNPLTAETGKQEGRDFFVSNPLETGMPLKICGKLNTDNLRECNRVLEASFFLPILDLCGYPRHFVYSRDPEKDLKLWAHENGRDPALVVSAVKLLYGHIPQISSLKQGKYRLGEILNRIIDEIICAGAEVGKVAGKGLLSGIIKSAFVEDAYLGAKTRPIGGLLPPGTSVAWKTPYGEDIPHYAHLEKCLGPECGLCVTHCPEGGGGKNSAIKMVLNVPRGTVSSLVRGLDVFLIKLDGSNSRYDETEDLSGRAPFEFEVDAEFCKACGICISCCPHDVIEPEKRTFDIKQAL